jgi:hypothetical protein
MQPICFTASRHLSQSRVRTAYHSAYQKTAPFHHEAGVVRCWQPAFVSVMQKVRGAYPTWLASLPARSARECVIPQSGVLSTVQN